MANDERWINGWINDMKKINQSPFYKESHHHKYKHGEPMEKVSFRMPKTAYNDLMSYFKGLGLSDSEGLNMILNKELEVINTSKRTIFNNIELIMVIPKTRNLKELNDKSFILTAYNTRTDFEERFIYDDGFKKEFNFNYELMDFLFFHDVQINIMNHLNNNIDVYGNFANPYLKGNWNEFHQRLEEINKIDLSKCYFVRFPLNNYLDVKGRGQYESSILRGWHDGLYVFDDFNKYRLYFRMEWKYLSEGIIKFMGEFISMTDFMYTVKNADMKNVRECQESLLNNTHDKEFMESALKEAEEMKEWIEDKIAFYKKNLGR